MRRCCQAKNDAKQNPLDINTNIDSIQNMDKIEDILNTDEKYSSDVISRIIMIYITCYVRVWAKGNMFEMLWRRRETRR